MRARTVALTLAPLAVLACATKSPETFQASPGQNLSPVPGGSARMNNPWPTQNIGQKGEGVPNFWIRPGYRVDLVMDLRNARFMELSDKGDLYVTRPDFGDIVTLRQRNGTWEQVGTFISGKRTVHGMHFFGGWLWFTTSGGVFKGRDTNGDGVADDIQDICPEGTLPHGGHWWRSILVTDKGFFTSIGDSGNANDLRTSDREKIWFFSLDGKTKKEWCGGLRNTEKLQFRPGTTELYGCDQGSDNFGQSLGENTGHDQPITDQVPPEEMNKYVEGGFYGHPFIMGNGVPRYEYMHHAEIIKIAGQTIAPEICFGPHWAADGWTFLNSDGLGEGFKGDALIAFHGSWNRVHKAGYRIERVMFDKVTGEPMGEQMLVGTLSPSEQTLARPVDCCELADGSVLFTDDEPGRIFRLSRVR